MKRLFLFLFGFLFFVVDTFAVCETGTFTVSVVTSVGGGCPYVPGTGVQCYLGSGCSFDSRYQPCTNCSFCQQTTIQQGNYYYTNCDGCNGLQQSSCETLAGNRQIRQVCTTRCTENPEVCNDLREQCEGAGGSFHSVVDNAQNCCRASCNVCGSGSMDAMYSAKVKICCENMQAPPDRNTTCITVNTPPSTCGMVWSSYGDFTDGWQCRDPSSSFEASAAYRNQCFPPSSSSQSNSSSSGGESSSSGGGSSSNDGECKECPWLDSILDTLTAQKHIVGDIYRCITTPGLCSQDSKDSLSIPEWVAEKFDSTISKQEETNKRLGKIDTSFLRQLNLDSAKLRSDTATRQVITNGVNKLDSTTDALNDSTRKWLRRIVDSMGVNKDSLAARIDSIVKYQKEFSEQFGESFDGFGDGFGKIDNLTDSAVKYFRSVLHYDSIYRELFSDSMGSIHQAIGDIGVNIGYNLGYGDTASSTLRQDLGGIKGAIDAIGDKLNGVPVDTVNGGSGWRNYVNNGVRVGDSIVSAYEWERLKNLNIDSVNDDALGRLSFKGDSLAAVVDDSLADLAVRLNDSLVRKNDSLKNHLPDSLNAWADSLVIWAPFADFDSIIYSTIGVKVPDHDQCPEECQKWTISIPIIGLYSYTVDFGLCLGRLALGNQSVLAFIKLLLRVVVAFTCVMVIYRTLTGLQ